VASALDECSERALRLVEFIVAVSDILTCPRIFKASKYLNWNLNGLQGEKINGKKISRHSFSCH
jgi:hypothetical protein